MAPTSRKAAPRGRVSKSQADSKKAWEDKLYFLWLHFQIKDGDKPNHAAVAAKLGISRDAAVRRYGQVKKLAKQIEQSKAPKGSFGFEDEDLNRVFEALETKYAHELVLR
ncbi:uncharacterized protein N7496_007216 [Penicillium cataractarum]|uniref:Uncharacterized protein n=1 Tax=Penicillium cataractarum TaxID=2100454 RepID=A0A9W9V864_9EURO|nr:uncharacterized protein N7496_007216 [Penicillium cataractarum]KAJ5371124.1 hypothetical protein N7496_007216 [Penicillium cataractarum]